MCAVSDLKGPSLYPNTSNKAHNLQARLRAPAAGLAFALTHLQRESRNRIDLKAWRKGIGIYELLWRILWSCLKSPTKEKWMGISTKSSPINVKKMESKTNAKKKEKGKGLIHLRTCVKREGLLPFPKRCSSSTHFHSRRRSSTLPSCSGNSLCVWTASNAAGSDKSYASPRPAFPLFMRSVRGSSPDTPAAAAYWRIESFA